MEALTALIAVAGTLAGAALSHSLQRRTLRRSEERASVARRREERLEAYAAYAGALYEFRRKLVHRWFVADGGATDVDLDTVTREAFEARTAMMSALFRIQLLTSDAELVALAVGAAEEMDTLYPLALSRDELRAARDRTREVQAAFVTAASRHVR